MQQLLLNELKKLIDTQNLQADLTIISLLKNAKNKEKFLDALSLGETRKERILNALKALD